MKHYFFSLSLIVFLTFSQVGQSQTIFNYGIELGVAFSQFPQNKSYIIQERNDIVSETTNPLYSPLLGLTSNLTIKKHFQLSAGIQYQMIGERYHYHRDGNDLLYNATYKHDQWRNQTFHKLCFPVSAGLTIKVWKLQPSFYIGYRPNYIIAGKYYYKNVFDHEDLSKSSTTEKKLNIFDTNDFELPPKKFNSQFFYGISIPYGHYEFTINYYKGVQITYAEYKPIDFCATGLITSFQNNEFSISVKYKFLNQKNKIVTKE